MFKKTIKYITIFCCLLPMSSQLLLSQVTIGSLDKPMIGALLDLKEKDGSGVNANKGMLLPRVQLTSISSLYPMLENDTDYMNNIDNKRNVENMQHMGLIVYNTNQCLNFSGEDAGVYIWDGSIWEQIVKPTRSTDVSVFVDNRDGQKYRYRSFGSDAGVWMIDNMRAQSYDTDYVPNISLNTTPVSSQSQANSLSNNASRIAYPNYSQAVYETYPLLGLRYTWVAATGKSTAVADSNFSEGDGDPNQLDVGEQGICPNGWHVPSDVEWNKLEQEIYNNAQKYSSYSIADKSNFSPLVWNNSWNTTLTQVLRGSSEPNYGHSLAMLNSCIIQADGTIVNNTAIGKSLSPLDGGFSVPIILGDYNEANKVGLYWTASRFYGGPTSYNAYSRYLYYQDLSQTRKVNPTTKNLFYVRCKQN